MLNVPVILIGNNPAPYRETVYTYVSKHNQEITFQAIYCSRREAMREWSFEEGKYPKIFLSETAKSSKHNNTKIWHELTKLNPAVVIITGFYPTMLYAWLWTLLKRKKLIVFTDGTLQSEKQLSVIHKFLRKLVFKKATAFIGTGKGSEQLYANYQLSTNRIFTSCLCVDNDKFQQSDLTAKPYDLMFSGQLIDRKMPLFFVAVAKAYKQLTGSCKVLLLGNGPLKEQVLKALDDAQIDYTYPGFVKQEKLPQYYAQSKCFLFPTQLDPWGVVVNEAMASGVPVITCDEAGVAHDLVLHNNNGFILPLNADIWAQHAATLINDQQVYNEFATKALCHVRQFSANKAGQGILDAIKFTLSKS